MSHRGRDTAVLVMSFGGPSALEEVEDFLNRFLGGRLPPRERIEEIKEKYRLIGGGSPLTEITLRQAKALEAEMARRGHRYQVVAAMRFSKPFVDDAVARIKTRGVRQLIALPLTPHRSKLSTGPYFVALDQAMTSQGAGFKALEATGWHAHPRFIEALEEKITEGLCRFAPEGRHTVRVIFSAHSLPERVVSDDPYIDDIKETISGLVERIGPLAWHLAFQSRSGGSEPWLEPDVGDVLNGCSRRGYRKVLVVPVGFVSDHMETLYDLDIKYRGQAESLGMHYERSPALNDSPRFIQALAQIVLERLEKAKAEG